MRQNFHKGISLFTMLAIGLLVIETSPTASANDAESVAVQDSAVSELLATTENDGLVTTMADLERASLLGVGSKFDDLLAQVELSADGSVELRYWKDHALAEEFASGAQRVGQSTALPVALIPVDFDPKSLREVASELSENDPSILRNVGLSSINSVMIDTRTGALTINTSNSSVTKIDYGGHRIAVETGVKTELQSKRNDVAP